MTVIEIYCHTCKEVIERRNVNIDKGESMLSQDPMILDLSAVPATHENHTVTVSRGENK